MAKWILSAESYGAFRSKKEYIPIPNPYGVTVITDRYTTRGSAICRAVRR